MLSYLLCWTLLSAALADVPSQMLAVRRVGKDGCATPDFSCIVTENVTTPKPMIGEVLIRVASSAVDPDMIRMLACPKKNETWCKTAPKPPYTLGNDMAGTVVATGLGSGFKVGDRVWSLGTGGYAEYAVAVGAISAEVPAGLDLTVAGTMPIDAMTDLGAFQTAGAPWKAKNFTVLIVAGTGGTGYMAVQLAKALGATRVVTAASGDGIPFAKSLGADVVVDYKKGSVFDAVPDRSVDVVLDNHLVAGNADRAMQKLKAPGGVFVCLNDLIGCKSKNPPAGVKQFAYHLGLPFKSKLELIAKFVTAGTMRGVVQVKYGLNDFKTALQAEAPGGSSITGHIHSKIAILGNTQPSSVLI